MGYFNWFIKFIKEKKLLRKKVCEIPFIVFLVLVLGGIVLYAFSYTFTKDGYISLKIKEYEIVFGKCKEIPKRIKRIIWEIGYDNNDYVEFNLLETSEQFFPWTYMINETLNNNCAEFPYTFNDSDQNRINIIFTLNGLDASHNLILLVKLAEEGSGCYFPLNIDINSNQIGLFKFSTTHIKENRCYKLGREHEIHIPKKFISAGENELVLENNEKRGAYIMFDYLRLFY